MINTIILDKKPYIRLLIELYCNTSASDYFEIVVSENGRTASMEYFFLLNAVETIVTKEEYNAHGEIVPLFPQCFQNLFSGVNMHMHVSYC